MTSASYYFEAMFIGLPLTEKCVLLVLANFSNSEGFSYPSYQTIADFAGIKRPAAIRAVSRLEKRELVSIERHENNSNTFTLLFDPVARRKVRRERRKDAKKERFREIWDKQ